MIKLRVDGRARKDALYLDISLKYVVLGEDVLLVGENNSVDVLQEQAFEPRRPSTFNSETTTYEDSYWVDINKASLNDARLVLGFLDMNQARPHHRSIQAIVDVVEAVNDQTVEVVSLGLLGAV